MSKTLDRLAKMLSKADATENEAERQAYEDKALAIAASASIDLTVAREHQAQLHRKQRPEVPEERQILVNDFGRRYNRKHFMDLFLAIASANDCRTLIGGTGYYAFPTGFPSDLDVVEALYATLSVHMEQQATAALKRGAHKETYKGFAGEPVTYSRVDGRTWRANFYNGYVRRLTSRLWAAKRAAEEAAGVTPENTSSSTALALVTKGQQVEAEYEKRVSFARQANHGRVGSYKDARESNPDQLRDSEALQAGQQAAMVAALGTEDDRAMGARSKGELS